MCTTPPIVSVPVRAAATGLAVTKYCTTPLVPVPVPPDVTTTHGTSEIADQVQLGPLVASATLPTPPLASNADSAGSIESTSHGAAAWVRMKVAPPAVMVAVRGVATVFAATAYSIVPAGPLPSPPETIESHPALETADHEQASPLVAIAVVPTPPVAGTDADSGVKPRITQGDAACETVCTKPPTAIVAVRGSALALAATE